MNSILTLKRPAAPSSEENPASPTKIRTFAVADAERLAACVKEPVLHFVMIGPDAKLAYSGIAVIESRITGEWFIITSSEFSFQGREGNYRIFERMFQMLDKQQAPIGIWTASQDLLLDLEDGDLPWPQMKLRLVPFLCTLSQADLANYFKFGPHRFFQH